MAEANRDQNRQRVMLGVSSIDNVTPTEIVVNPVTNAVQMQLIGDPGRVITVGNRITRDRNYVPVMCGVSSVDNVTPVPVHCTPEGRIVIATA